MEARFAALRRREKPLAGLALVSVAVGAPFVLAALIPDLSARLAMYVAAALALVALTVLQRRREGLLREIGLVCPRCGATQAADLLYLGRCPSCQMQLLDRAELQAMPKAAITEGSPLRNAIGLVVLLGLMAWSLYHVVRVLGNR